MASELSKFIDDELQKVDTAEERERLISKLRVRTSAKDAGSSLRAAAAPSWQEQLLPRKRLLIVGLCSFFVIAIATVAITKGGSSSKSQGLEMGTSNEYAYEGEQDETSKLIDNAYPEPGEPSAKTIAREGDIPPPGREQGVESNVPGSPAINIRDDDGSSVPSSTSKDALDDVPPIPPNHKHSSPVPSNRKMGPSSPEVTPATASSKGHQTADDKAIQRVSDEDREDYSEDYSEEEGPVKDMDLAPSPELSEQRKMDRDTEDFEAEVERRSEEKLAEAAAERYPDEKESAVDPVYGSQEEGETPAEKALEEELAPEKQHEHAAHPTTGLDAVQEAEEAADAEEEDMMAERNELEAEQAEAEGLDRATPLEDEYEG